MNKVLIFTALALAAQVSLAGQNTVKFSAEASKTEVLQGNYIQVTFTLENGQGGKFSPPDWNAAGFIVRGGPNQSSSFSMINGETKSSLTYTYFVEPKNEGEAVVPEAKMVVGSETYLTKPLTIKVLPNPDGVQVAPEQPTERYDFWGRPVPDEPTPTPPVTPKKKRPTTRI